MITLGESTYFVSEKDEYQSTSKSQRSEDIFPSKCIENISTLNLRDSSYLGFKFCFYDFWARKLKLLKNSQYSLQEKLLSKRYQNIKRIELSRFSVASFSWEPLKLPLEERQKTRIQSVINKKNLESLLLWQGEP